jgi:hypothetical protein
MEGVKKIEEKEIVVLDEGIDLDVMPDAAACCWGPIFPALA